MEPKILTAESLFLKKYGNKITASESWVIRFAEEYGKLKSEIAFDAARDRLNHPDWDYIYEDFNDYLNKHTI